MSNKIDDLRTFRTRTGWNLYDSKRLMENCGWDLDKALEQALASHDDPPNPASIAGRLYHVQKHLRKQGRNEGTFMKMLDLSGAEWAALINAVTLHKQEVERNETNAFHGSREENCGSTGMTEICMQLYAALAPFVEEEEPDAGDKV